MVLKWPPAHPQVSNPQVPNPQVPNPQVSNPLKSVIRKLAPLIDPLATVVDCLAADN